VQADSAAQGAQPGSIPTNCPTQQSQKQFLDLFLIIAEPAPSNSQQPCAIEIAAIIIRNFSCRYNPQFSSSLAQTAFEKRADCHCCAGAYGRNAAAAQGGQPVPFLHKLALADYQETRRVYQA
jgi:hypothetical protein